MAISPSSTCVTPRSYQFDPYNAVDGKKFISLSNSSADWGNSSAASTLSPSTSEACFPARVPLLHEPLVGVVDFVLFPADGRDAPRLPEHYSKAGMVRLFIGQLPFAVTDAQLDFAIATVAGGHRAYCFERIVNWKKGRTPTGCVHAYCVAEDVDFVLAANLCVLFDEHGVWCARTADQASALREYSRSLAAQKGQRTATNMPNQPMTVEKAKSTYVRDEEYAIHSFPAYRQAPPFRYPFSGNASEPARFSKTVPR